MIDAAVILAGGRGSRLAPWPAPKCLLPINGVPIIERIIRHVDSHVGRIIVCTGYRSGDVMAALRHREGGRLLFSDAGEDATMCERLLRARDEHKFGRVLVLYGDELADVDVDTLVRHHDEHGARLTFTCFEQKLPFGVVYGSRIDENIKMPVNIGFAVVDVECWRQAEPGDGFSDFVNNVHFNFVVEKYTHRGRRTTVNGFSDLAHAEEVWA